MQQGVLFPGRTTVASTQEDLLSAFDFSFFFSRDNPVLRQVKDGTLLLLDRQGQGGEGGSTP